MSTEWLAVNGLFIGPNRSKTRLFQLALLIVFLPYLEAVAKKDRFLIKIVGSSID
jgi:hypothetical protein